MTSLVSLTLDLVQDQGLRFQGLMTLPFYPYPVKQNCLYALRLRMKKGGKAKIMIPQPSINKKQRDHRSLFFILS